MAKVTDSYDSVILGVSQQAANNRRSGQMEEQLNMVSDPVRGVSRRAGSLFLAEQKVNSTPDASNVSLNYSKYLVKPLTIRSQGFDLLYNRRPLSGDKLPTLSVYSKETKAFVPVNGDGTYYNQLRTAGTSAVVNIGNYVFLSLNGVPVTYTTQSHVSDTDTAGVVWVRNGDYSREYTVRLVINGSSYAATYKTPPSTYPSALDTSGVPVPTLENVGPETAGDDLQRAIARFNEAMSVYNKQVADITNTYNSAVTSYIGEAAAAIQPNNIALKLRDAIIQATPLTSNQVFTQGSYITVGSGYLVSGGEAVSVNDTYIKAVFRNVNNVEDLTPRHYYGHVVRVKPKKSTGKDVYYMKAEPTDTNDPSGFGPVQWQETAGVEVKPGYVFLVGTIHQGVFYIRDNPDALAAATGLGDVPRFVSSKCGDLTSTPPPAFLDEAITYMGVFQDRLLIGTGSTIFASRPGDYFNWFRQTVLDVLDNDPVEVFALGSESDTIQWDVPFDRNLVLYGRKYQYLLNGRTTFTAKNPSIQIISTIEDAVLAAPQSSGSLVFYGKDLLKKGALLQMQVGATTESIASYECSQQLDDYIKGRPVQLLCTQAPWSCLLRTEGTPNGLYVYTYQDTVGGERQYDSWSRWEWDTRLGSCVGISRYEEYILVYTLRVNASGTYLVVDSFSLDTMYTGLPHLDSQMPYSSKPAWRDSSFDDVLSVVYSTTSPYNLLGTSYKDLSKNIPDWSSDVQHLVVGVNSAAELGVTLPYMRDREGRSLLDGRLTVSSLDVTVQSTGGMLSQVVTGGTPLPPSNFSARLLTRLDNRVGRAPIVSGTIKVPVYKETRECTVTLKALTWLPLSITNISWTGQWFRR